MKIPVKTSPGRFLLLDPSDIYQTFLYAHALGRRVDSRPPSSLIFYPASSPDMDAVRLPPDGNVLIGCVG